MNAMTPSATRTDHRGFEDNGAATTGVSADHTAIRTAIDRFVAWLDSFGELSQDHQDFYASRLGRASKALYYRNPFWGKLAVMPMVGCEAFAPWTRRFFYPPMRLPISDAHYAMAFAYLHRITGDKGHLERAVHFLEILEETRSPGFRLHGWGYPFDWQTRRGVIVRQTPLITTVPYCYEAFRDVFRIDGQPRWENVMRSIAEHMLLDYGDVATGTASASCTYTPTDGTRVVNANAYRAFGLFCAATDFADERYRHAAARNLNFVLESQHSDGSWPYAVDGTRGFVDHFHTCFVMKALAKIELLTGNVECTRALARGVDFYTGNLFEEQLPRPFARAPRLTVYRRELYDCAECINLGVLLRGRFPKLDAVVDRTIREIVHRWQRPDGHFRSRQLWIGWDDVPMHRWGQSQIFRALCAILVGSSKRSL